MKLTSIKLAFAALLFGAATMTAGCIVRTTPGRSTRGHQASHRHDHCHSKKGNKHSRNHKKVCHSHPHKHPHH